MRLILLMDSVGTGGAELSSLQFYGWLASKGHEVKLVVLKEVKPSYVPAQFGVHEVLKLSSRNLFSRTQELIRIIKSFKPDVLHSVLFKANLTGRLARMYSKDFIHVESLVNEMYSEHRYRDPHVTRGKLLAYRMLDWLTQLWGVDHYHANGVSVADHYRQKLGISEKRITVVPRGREANPLLGDQVIRRKIREEFSVNDRLLIINTGRQEFQKGQDVLIRAVSALTETERNRIKVVIVGREGNQTTSLKQLIKHLHLEDYVTLSGHRDDVPAMLSAADIFVFPSRFEGLSGALIEAEAAGLPIVCSAIPNNLEIVRPDINAYTFPVNDKEGLASSIKKLVLNEWDGREKGKASLDIFKQNFLIQKVHDRLEQLLIDLSNRS